MIGHNMRHGFGLKPARHKHAKTPTKIPPVTLFLFCLYFYRAMHYSEKRGIEIACRPSVCFSVMTSVDQDHIGWKSWKLIARSVSPTSLLFVPRGLHLYPGEHEEIFGRRGMGKSGVLEHKSGNISEARKYRGKVTMEGL